MADAHTLELTEGDGVTVASALAEAASETLALELGVCPTVAAGNIVKLGLNCSPEMLGLDDDVCDQFEIDAFSEIDAEALGLDEDVCEALRAVDDAVGEIETATDVVEVTVCVIEEVGVTDEETGIGAETLTFAKTAEGVEPASAAYALCDASKGVKRGDEGGACARACARKAPVAAPRATATYRQVRLIEHPGPRAIQSVKGCLRKRSGHLRGHAEDSLVAAYQHASEAQGHLVLLTPAVVDAPPRHLGVEDRRAC